MRLTLRTMLAHIDGILEPEDAEDIRKKIEESEFATNLLHRMRDAMRRLRLTAPSLSERGPGLDANTVAEYLDNTMHDGRVPDFERVCLESDIHLAEVASCHQILTLVLGEAAEIDPATRQRMYELLDLQAAQAVAVAPPVVPVDSGDGQPESQPPADKVRARPTVPEYLREAPKTRRLLPAAVVLAVTVCFAVIALTALGQFERDTWLGRLLFSPEDTEVAGPGLPKDEQPPVDGDLPEEPPPEEPSDPPVIDPTADPMPEVPDDPSEDPAAAAEPGPTADPVVEPPTEPVIDPTADPMPEVPDDPREDPAAAAEPGPPEKTGALMSDRQVLLRFDPATDTWQRVPAQGTLATRKFLLALPTYRPLIALMSAGATLQLTGGTRVELLPSNDQGIPGVRVVFGQVILRTVEQAKVQLEVGQRAGVITLGNADSIAALEVTRARVPGTDPETKPGLLVADLYAAAGQVFWDEAGRETVAVQANTALPLDERLSPAAPAELPKWISESELTLWDPDRLASPKLAEDLQVGRPAGLGLAELANERRKELSWLAARCLGYLGQFDAMLDILNDPTKKTIWPHCIQAFEAAVARGPDVAAQVRQAMERKYGQEANGLHRMLWGYTEKDLKSGQARELVHHLEHKTLAFRVVSFASLKELTNWTLRYEPEDSDAERRIPTQNWKQRLESGEIWTRVAEKRASRPVPAPTPVAPPPEETLP